MAVLEMTVRDMIDKVVKAHPCPSRVYVEYYDKKRSMLLIYRYKRGKWAEYRECVRGTLGLRSYLLISGLNKPRLVKEDKPVLRKVIMLEAVLELLTQKLNIDVDMVL